MARLYALTHPRDGVMDDLNRDGKPNYRDAHYLNRLADRLLAEKSNRRLTGGQGVYERSDYRGPFLHVDVRAVRARRGLIPAAMP